MAPAGAMKLLAAPGLDPKARIIGLLYFSFLIFTMLPYSSGLPTRTERLISENDRFYWEERDNGRIQCQVCPPGTYVEEPCTIEFSLGKCAMCPEGTYTALPSGLNQCISCSRCRNDEEEVASCSIIKDTVCHCKKGTFCPPNQLCEICMPCTSSCPEDQVEKTPCNATSDILCTNPGSSTDTNHHIAWIVPVVVSVCIIVACMLWFLWWKKRKQGTRILGKLSFSICKENEDRDETQDEMLKRDILQFKEGIDLDTKDEIIAKSCAIIVQTVPVKDFERLMQHLGLSHNEIDVAKVNNKGDVINQNNAMLQAWYKKKDFDINSLLKALRNLHMEKAAHDIKSQLLEDKLYILQSQPNS